ncbi:MAG: ATPase AAA-2 domain protein [Parcubacteria group bacterium GW2011_GWD2_38_11]|nr:MAG: ATPase AAA-2 domain protein [Parcubacteria group bacterium GW2011_GWD2_38_11]
MSAQGGSAPGGQKRPNFIHWYYNEAVHKLLEIWKNFLFFVWQHFSILELSKTLLSPWRRDVTFSTWTGLHPIKMLTALFENIISRVLGAIVRTFVILTGLGVFVLVIMLGLAINIVWVGAPLLLVVFLFYTFSLKTDFYYSIGLPFAWIIGVIALYYQDTKTQMLFMDFEQLLRHSVFARICGRLGIARKRFPNEIFGNRELFNEFLKAGNLTEKDYLRLASNELSRQQVINDKSKFWRWEYLKKIPAIGMQWRYAYTVDLDRYCLDLSASDWTEYAKADLVGRADEYEVLKLVLERPDQNCALMVGSAGIGKKTLIHCLAKKVRFNDENGILSNKRMLVLDLGRVISDAISRGQDVENSLRRLFYQASYAGNVILIIEHFEYFLGKEGSSFHPDISAVLAEFLHIPTFQIIAVSTPKEYHQLIEKQEEIAKYFEVIEVREPSEDETITILLNQLEKYEHRRVLFTFKALEKIVRDSAKHNWEFPLPERAIDLAMGVLMFWEKKSVDQFISEKTVADYLSLKTGVPQGEIEGGERKKLLNLEAMLHRQVIGQKEAIDQVSQALRRARSGIGNSQKPVGSFLFLGPTGVGKTETAKALAKTYFGDENRMIRLDMSEFQTPSSIDRLLGSSQLNQPGRLVTQIKDNPYSLLLLDEIEKAYPEILDIFLQILDEGYVNDAFGEKINFRNTMIIATSNAGAALIKKMVEQENPAEEIKQAVIDYAIENNIFRTEFLNRFEGVIFFRPLNSVELKNVARLQLQKFVRRLAKEKNIELAYDESVIEKIIQKGYNPIFGARSLNRYIEDEVESLVAKKIISGETLSGEKITLSL